MGLFSKKPKRNATGSLDGWTAERWSGLVKSVSMSAEMYCEKYSAEMASSRATAATQLASGARGRARAAAELALRNRAKVRALSRLAVLAAHLHDRDLSIESLPTLKDAREPARTELVSLVYASGRLNVQPLTEAVAMLRGRFPDDVDEIIRAKAPWPDFFDTRLYDALTPGPADDDLVEAELAAAAKEFSSPSQLMPLQNTGFHQDHAPHLNPNAPPPYVAPNMPHSASPPPPPPPMSVPVLLPKPWEDAARAHVSSGVRGAAMAPPPPPPAPGSEAKIPDYALRFTDSDEVLLMRYRDLLTG